MPGATMTRGLTFFTVPKPFRDAAAVAQTNAIRSWSRLAVADEVIVFGDEPGAAEAAGRLGVRHAAGLARNELGTPLVGDVFARARREARSDTLCFINADVILTGDFSAAVAALPARRGGFLMVGRRTDLDVPGELAMDAGWEEALRREAGGAAPGRATAIDYFVFPRDLFDRVPAFAVGRAGYDNWLLFEARRRGAWVVDASHDVLAVHQRHGYAHVPGNPGSWEGPESDRNRALAGGWDYLLDIDDATHRLVDGRLRRARRRSRLRRRLVIQRLLHPRWAAPLGVLLAAVDLTHPLRSRLGLAENPRGAAGKGPGA